MSDDNCKARTCAKARAVANHRAVEKHRQAMIAAAERLTRDVLLLREAHGFSHQQVADLLGISRGGAQQIAQREALRERRRKGEP